MNRLRPFVFLASLLFFPRVPFLTASTIHVPAQQPTIQDGINAAKK